MITNLDDSVKNAIKVAAKDAREAVYDCHRKTGYFAVCAKRLYNAERYSVMKTLHQLQKDVHTLQIEFRKYRHGDKKWKDAIRLDNAIVYGDCVALCIAKDRLEGMIEHD